MKFIRQTYPIFIHTGRIAETYSQNPSIKFIDLSQRKIHKIKSSGQMDISYVYLEK
jgi:hypothetical protein